MATSPIIKRHQYNYIDPNGEKLLNIYAPQPIEPQETQEPQVAAKEEEVPYEPKYGTNKPIDWNAHYNPPKNNYQ